MPESVVNLLVQVPLVGAFIYFSLKIVDIFTKEMRERDQAWRDWLDLRRDEDNVFKAKLAEEIASLTKCLTEHDAFVRAQKER